MFTKDKKREGAKKPPVPQEKRRPRPAEEGAAEPRQRRRPAEDQRRPADAERRRPPEQRTRPAEAQRRRPGEERRRPQEAEHRRPPEQRTKPAEDRRRRPPEQRRQPAESRRAPENEQEAIRQIMTPQPEQAQNPAPDQVYEIRQQPRETPATSRGKRRRPESAQASRRPAKMKKRGAAAVKEPPQGTSYHRSTPKQKKTLRDLFIKKDSKFYRDPEQQAAAARARQAARAETKAKFQRLAKKLDTPAVVYTQPKPFNRNRLLIQLITVLAVASAFVMGLSVFFKVKVITVSGADTYSPYAIQQASGIMEGDNLLTFGRARASGLITANLPYVSSVRIGIKLPDTVNIEVEEIDVAYSIESGDGDWWLITSGGKVVKQIPGSTAKNYTKIMGVQVENPQVGQEVSAVEAVPDAAPEGETQTAEIPVTVTGAMRLNAVMQILRALEDNDIVGDAATVNVENLEKIELWYGQRYQVSLGDATNLDYKIACMYDVILQFEDYQTGMLDISFTKKKDQVIYTPFV